LKGNHEKKRGRSALKHPKKRFSTRLGLDVLAWLDRRKIEGFSKAGTIEAALNHYKNFLAKKGGK